MLLAWLQRAIRLLQVIGLISKMALLVIEYK